MSWVTLSWPRIILVTSVRAPRDLGRHPLTVAGVPWQRYHRACRAIRSHAPSQHFLWRHKSQKTRRVWQQPGNWDRIRQRCLTCSPGRLPPRHLTPWCDTRPPHLYGYVTGEFDLVLKDKPYMSQYVMKLLFISQAITRMQLYICRLDFHHCYRNSLCDLQHSMFVC